MRGYFAFAMSIGLMCGCTGGDGPGASAGQASGPCYSNNTCNLGLACISDRCEIAETGQEYGTCFPNMTCNDGLECVEGFCWDPTRPDAGMGTADASQFSCDDDSEIEPNENLGSATSTGVTAAPDQFTQTGLAICPSTDADFFRMDLDVAGLSLRADVDHDPDQGGLIVEVLNAGGAVIESGEPLAANPNIVRAEVIGLPAGTFYVQVHSTGVENNYSIEIVASGN